MKKEKNKLDMAYDSQQSAEVLNKSMFFFKRTSVWMLSIFWIGAFSLQTKFPKNVKLWLYWTSHGRAEIEMYCIEDNWYFSSHYHTYLYKIFYQSLCCQPQLLNIFLIIIFSHPLNEKSLALSYLLALSNFCDNKSDLISNCVHEGGFFLISMMEWALSFENHNGS